MSATAYNLSVEQNATYALTVTAQDSTGSAINLTGYTIYCGIRLNYGDTPIIGLVQNTGTSLSGIKPTDLASGKFQIYLIPADTLSLSPTTSVTHYFYDVFLTNNSDGSKIKLIYGSVFVSPAYTQLGTSTSPTTPQPSGSVPYISSNNVVAYLAPSTAGYVLSSNGTGNAPSWISGSSIPITLSGDVTGPLNSTSVVKVNGSSLPINKTLVGTNSSGQIIDSSSATISNNTTGNAATASIASSASNLINSTVGSVPYTSGSNTTSFLPPSSTTGYVLSSQGVNQPPSWIQNTAVTTSANTVIGGTNGQILQSTGASSSTWISGTYLTSGSLGLNPNTSGQDCSVAFQNAINAVAATSHQRLLITAGNYYFTKTIIIPAQVKIVGEVAGDRGGYSPWVYPYQGSNQAGNGPYNFATRLIFTSTPATISATASSGSKTLTINTTGISVGMQISGTGIMSGTFVVDTPSTNPNVSAGTINVSTQTTTSLSGTNLTFVPSALYIPLSASTLLENFELYSTNTSKAVGQCGTGVLIANGDWTGYNGFESNSGYFNGNEQEINSIFVHDFDINVLMLGSGGGAKIYNSNFSFARTVNLQFSIGNLLNPNVGSPDAAGTFEINNCFIGGMPISGTTPQQYQGDAITSFGGKITLKNTWLYQVVHGGNFARGTIYIENLFTESNYSNDYFFKAFSFTSITINNGAFAIPNDFVNSGLPVFDLTSSGSANLTLNNVSGFISPVYSLAGAGSVTSIPNISNQAEYQVYGSPFQLTGNITSGSNSIANVPITSAMYVGSSTSTIASGNTYLILSTGSNFTSFGSANNSVGTVFSATSGGTAIGTAQQLNITVGNSYFLAGYGLQNSVVGAGGFVSGQTYKILNVGSLGYAYTDFTSVGASNNNVGTYFTATGSGSGVGKALLISTITAISGTGGTYLTITISNNANQTVTGGLFSFSRLASSNLLGMSGSLFTKGTATPDLVFPNSYGTSNLPTYAVGSYNTGIYSSGVDGNGSQIINLTNSGNASYQFSKNLLSLTQSSARVNFPSISAVANTPIIQFGGSGGGGIGYPSTGNGNAISLQGNVNGSTQDLLIAGGLSGKPYLAISSANGLSGTFTLVAGTKAVGNVNITANSVVIVTLRSSGGTRTGNPDIVLNAGTGFTATGGVLDTSTYNYIILSASN